MNILNANLCPVGSEMINFGAPFTEDSRNFFFCLDNDFKGYFSLVNKCDLAQRDFTELLKFAVEIIQHVKTEKKNLSINPTLNFFPIPHIRNSAYLNEAVSNNLQFDLQDPLESFKKFSHYVKTNSGKILNDVSNAVEDKGSVFSIKIINPETLPHVESKSSEIALFQYFYKQVMQLRNNFQIIAENLIHVRKIQNSFEIDIPEEQVSYLVEKILNIEVQNELVKACYRQIHSKDSFSIMNFEAQNRTQMTDL